MAYKITSQCISCNLCESVCPTGAIKVEGTRHWIDSALCTDCVGSIHTVPQCKAGCPTCDGCVKETNDYWESWFAKYNRVIGKLTKKQDYWERWFDCYSQKFMLSNIQNADFARVISFPVKDVSLKPQGSKGAAERV